MLDAEYKDIQLNELHEGNTEQFINELFCGNFADKEGFKCLRFADLQRLKFVKSENTEDGYTVYYKVSDGSNEVICTWLVTVHKTNNKTTYGIFGAVG